MTDLDPATRARLESIRQRWALQPYARDALWRDAWRAAKADVDYLLAALDAAVAERDAAREAFIRVKVREHRVKEVVAAARALQAEYDANPARGAVSYMRLAPLFAAVAALPDE